jgi:hypothetical protein
MILRNMKSDVFEYSTFDSLLYDVRFELARSRLMDTNLDQLGEHLAKLFSESDYENNGLISINDARAALLTSKKTILTPF